MIYIFDNKRFNTRQRRKSSINNSRSLNPRAIVSAGIQSRWTPSLLLLLITGFLILTVSITVPAPVSAQSFTRLEQSIIQGKVTDSTGSPLAGVHIATAPVYGNTYTDHNGRFTLAINGLTKIITVEKAGFQTQILRVKKIKSPLSIQLLKAPKSTSAADTGNHPLHSLEKIPGINVISGNQPIAPTGQIMIRGLSGSKVAALSGRMPSIYFSRQENTESYAHVKENGFKSTTSAPLSTFSIDVDKASYSNVRRFINEGRLPPENAVRIEELINYFDYAYQQPTGKDPVRIHTELSTAPWNPRHYLLQIGLQAKKVATDKLPPSNLVFLIDVSGSMASGNKLPLLISSFKMLTDQLRPQDYVSIVTYAGNAQNVLAPTSGADKKAIKSALDQLRAYGSTNGAGGLEKAYELAAKHFKDGGNNRIILASDGDFNVGASSMEDLETLITDKRKSGIYLSVLGFGMGNLKDDHMELLADKGNGNYAYIDNSSEARRVLLKEFGGTLFTVAKDVKVQVEFNPALVDAYRLVGYENRALNDADFNQDTVDAGEMGSGSTVTALYEIIAHGVQDTFTPVIDKLRYDSQGIKKSSNGELLFVKIRYKDPAGSKSKLISQMVPNKPKPAKATSADFQLAAAAAGWGMLLKKSPYKQLMTYPKLSDLLQNSLQTDRDGQIGAFLNLVQTSEALVGNEVKSPNVDPRPKVRPYYGPIRRLFQRPGLKEEARRAPATTQISSK